MNGERENLDYAQLIEALHRLCREGRTGTMFVCTDDNQALRFVLEKGRVMGCAYRRKHGREALTLIQEVKGGRYSFSEGMFMTEEVPMPDTSLLFQLLENHRPPQDELELDALHRELAQEEPPPAPAPPPPVVPTATPVAPKLAAPQFRIPAAEVIQGMVESELALLLGPVGPLIAAQFAEAAEGIETDEQLIAFIEQVRAEIPDERQSLEFRRALLEQFR